MTEHPDIVRNKREMFAAFDQAKRTHIKVQQLEEEHSSATSHEMKMQLEHEKKVQGLLLSHEKSEALKLRLDGIKALLGKIVELSGRKIAAADIDIDTNGNLFIGGDNPAWVASALVSARIYFTLENNTITIDPLTASKDNLLLPDALVTGYIKMKDKMPGQKNDIARFMARSEAEAQLYGPDSYAARVAGSRTAESTQEALR